MSTFLEGEIILIGFNRSQNLGQCYWKFHDHNGGPLQSSEKKHLMGGHVLVVMHCN